MANKYSGLVFDFGTAIKALKEGHKVARRGWNGKGIWVVLMPSLYLDKDVVNARTTKHIGEGVDLDSQPYFVVWTADKKWQPGWHPTTRDCLAEDYYVVE